MIKTRRFWLFLSICFFATGFLYFLTQKPGFVRADPGLPDLVITDIWVSGSDIYYKIKNQGEEAVTGTSASGFWLDGVYRFSDKDVPGLASGEEKTRKLEGFTWTCSGSSDKIMICADYVYQFSESNEGNNCRTETFDCPPLSPGPDLIIGDIVYFGVSTYSKWADPDYGVWPYFTYTSGCCTGVRLFADSYPRLIFYHIKNQGMGASNPSYASLWIDGIKQEFVPCPEYECGDRIPGLSSGESGPGYVYHPWVCSGESDTITVCADGLNETSESNETNNCRTEEWDCPPLPDPPPAPKTWVISGYVRDKHTNKGIANVSIVFYRDGQYVNWKWTNSSGYYEFTTTSDQEYLVMEVRRGPLPGNPGVYGEVGARNCMPIHPFNQLWVEGGVGSEGIRLCSQPPGIYTEQNFWVLPPAPSCTLTANPSSGDEPLSGTLVWTTTNYPDSCVACGAWEGSKNPAGGSEAYGPLGVGAYTYSLSCTNVDRTSTCSATVNVSVPSQPPDAQISCQSVQPNCSGYSNEPPNFKNNSISGSNPITQSKWDITNRGGIPDWNNPDHICSVPICDYTPQFLGLGDYTIHLRVEDSNGLSDIVILDFTILRDAEANSVCSVDNLNWYVCEEMPEDILPHQGETIYLLDDPDSADSFIKDHSTKISQGASTVQERKWKIVGQPNPFDEDNNTTAQLELQGETTIELWIKDDKSRTDTVQHTISANLSLPEWKEIRPF